MTDCSRCQDRRTNPQLLCPLMLIDEFCHAAGQQEDITWMQLLHQVMDEDRAILAALAKV